MEEENADDDMEEDDDDPLNYINTAYDDGELMAQDYDSGYERGDDDLMLPDLLEPERPKAECKKSLFKQSSGDASRCRLYPATPRHPSTD